MAEMDFPHRRYNALTGDWVLVSPHRTKRPWQGKQDPPTKAELPPHDPACYLCPGNQRASGDINPAYLSTYVFTNDFAALLPESGSIPEDQHPLMLARSVRGTSRVLCFSPRHDLWLARMEINEIVEVIQMWIEQHLDLDRDYRWVQIFENRGAMMGSSMPHPHGQVWASDSLPNELLKENRTQKEHMAEHGQTLLLEYLSEEKKQGERIVIENEDWVALVPYWAVWPFETLLLPTAPVSRMPDLTPVQQSSLADILKRLLTRYDNLFSTPFPYSMGWHPAPNGGDAAHWQLHAHFYPPLLRSASVRKFLVGYELLAEAQRDITAEQAAARLRGLSGTHYLG